MNEKSLPWRSSEHSTASEHNAAATTRAAPKQPASNSTEGDAGTGGQVGFCGVCPVCGARLMEIRGKLICSRCHTICETCCEGGPT